jgi:hypothetical protein
LKEGRCGKLREGRSVEERIEKYVWSLSSLELFMLKIQKRHFEVKKWKKKMYI